MHDRSGYLRLYYSTGKLDPTLFPERDDVRCHALKDLQSVIFYNHDSGAVSATLPSLDNIARNTSIIRKLSLTSLP
jgi:hypothetical protein